MTIEATLQLEFNNNSFLLMVKMIRVEKTSYFFIRDKEEVGGMLSGKTLELTFIDSFSLTEFGGIIKSQAIPKKVLDVIQKAILDNKETWFLPDSHIKNTLS